MFTLVEATPFFERYRNDFDKCDWDAFSSLFHEPFITVRGDGSVHLLQSRAATRQFFEMVSAGWRREGYSRCATANFEVMSLGKFSALVTFDWDLLRQDGSSLRNWRQSYQLIDVGDGWKVLASTFHASQPVPLRS
jgi:hypothetical protein